MMRRSFGITGLVFGVVLLFNSLARAEGDKAQPPAADLFLKNPNYKPEGTPAKESKLRLRRGEKAVRNAFSDLEEEIQARCARHQNVFRINSTASELKVTAFKNWNVPVAAKFKNFSGYVAWDNETLHPQSTLLIDSGSWDSGVAARDSRVKGLLLKAQKKAFAFTRLDLELPGQFDAKSGERDLKGKINFRGQDYEIDGRSQMKKNATSWTVTSAKPLRFVPKLPNEDLLEIMKLCNHEALTPAVDLHWNLTFEPACAK